MTTHRRSTANHVTGRQRTAADPTGDVRGRDGMAVVLSLLFVSGWAANHFTALIPALKDTGRFSTGILDGGFGVYAIGLLPGLLGGGRVSDAMGRRPVVMAGVAVAAAGNLLMLVSHGVTGVYAGRLIVGVGVGLSISAGTAWAADLRGKQGATLAGVVLTSGFATGPVASGVLAQFLHGPTRLDLPFALTVAASITALLLAVRVAPAAAPAEPQSSARPEPGAPAEGQRRVGLALAVSVPMALWVFSTVTISIVVLAGRMTQFSGPWVPGAASLVTLGTGLAVQILARRMGWGPRSGVVGAGLAALGLLMAGLAGSHPPAWSFLLCALSLGCAYGLCLRDGLTDVDLLAPAARRGSVLGVFYVCTYIGFGLPVLLEALRSRIGVVAPLAILAGLAASCAVIRAMQIPAVYGASQPSRPTSSRTAG